VWDNGDWILMAAATLITLFVTKGWPVIQWFLEFSRKAKVEDLTDDERREERNAKLRAEGYEQVITRLDREDKLKSEKLAKLEHEHMECLRTAARMEERIKYLEQEAVRNKEQIDVLLAWKRSRGGSDTITQIVQAGNPKPSNSSEFPNSSP